MPKQLEARLATAKRTIAVALTLMLVMIGVMAWSAAGAREARKAVVASELKARTTLAELNAFKAAAFKRCEERLKYDTQANAFREVEAAQFAGFAEQERTNPYIDSDLRRKRVEAWLTLAAGANDTVVAQVRSSCEVYR